MDQPRNAPPLEQQHGIDVGGTDPRPEMKVRRGDLRVAVSAESDGLASNHRLSPLDLDTREP